MNIQKILENPRFRLEQRDPTPPDIMKEFLREAPPNLPVKYIHFMRQTDGAKGDIPYDSGYIEIWPLEDAIGNQAGYGMQDNLPGFFAFASDGKDRIFVFDLRAADGAPVLSADAGTPGKADLEEIAPSFSQFLEHIALMHGGG